MTESDKIHSSLRAFNLSLHLLDSEQQLFYDLLLIVVLVLIFLEHLHLLLQLLDLELKLLLFHYLEAARLRLGDAHLVYLPLEVCYLLDLALEVSRLLFCVVGHVLKLLFHQGLLVFCLLNFAFLLV